MNCGGKHLRQLRVARVVWCAGQHRASAVKWPSQSVSVAAVVAESASARRTGTGPLRAVDGRRDGLAGRTGQTSPASTGMLVGFGGGGAGGGVPSISRLAM